MTRTRNLCVTATICFVALTTGPAQAQQQSAPTLRIPMPTGMPRLPPGTPIGVSGRPMVKIIAPNQNDQNQGNQSQNSNSGQSGSYEIYGQTNAGTPRFAVIGAPKPQFYVVRRGDTLWDICETYFQNPWMWPKIWAMNPEISNPHWIYPGDRLALRKTQQRQRAASRTPAAFGTVHVGPQEATGDVWLRLLGFVTEQALKHPNKVTGAFNARIMQTTGDVVYIKTTKRNPLQVGKRYSVFKPVRVVRRPGSKHRIGRMVEIDADVEINKILWRGKSGIARGTILRAVNPVERGFLVGKLHRRYRSVHLTTNQKIRTLRATIVAVLGPHQIIGTDELVFLDRGTDDGLLKGYVLNVIRQGDGYRRIRNTAARNRQAFKHWPNERVGVLVVVHTGKHHAAAIVYKAREELRVGDVAQLRYSPAK
ncbi:MAG: LysM peptidoglycan-binding domain-containing protein [Deltaproteobacteria bacterium]|nr:LysM peptidoglycan-binding domain-containing protein [Deltaproteobacteria bacterium]